MVSGVIFLHSWEAFGGGGSHWEMWWSLVRLANGNFGIFMTFFWFSCALPYWVLQLFVNVLRKIDIQCTLIGKNLGSNCWIYIVLL